MHCSRKLLTKEMAKMLWQINIRELTFLADTVRHHLSRLLACIRAMHTLQKSRSKSLGSLRTISTAVSDETTEALAKGDKVRPPSCSVGIR